MRFHDMAAARLEARWRPILADESIEDVIPLPGQLVGDGSLIMLRVVGDSMINAAIADGDWVVARRESDVENGDIVAATFESDTPHNPAYVPSLGDEAKILGKVVAVLRRV